MNSLTGSPGFLCALASSFSALILSACGGIAINPPKPIFEDEKVLAKKQEDPATNSGRDPYLAFNRALLLAQAPNPSADANVNLLNEGLGLIEFNCNKYFVTLGRTQQELGYIRKETSLTGGLVSGMLGLSGATPKAIANIGSIFGFSAASMDSYQDAYLFSPEIKAVQKLVLSALDAFREELSEKLSGTQPQRIIYSDVAKWLSRYEAHCQPHGIRDLVNQSLNQAKASTKPASVDDILSSFYRASVARAVNRPSISDPEMQYLYWLAFKYDKDQDEKILVEKLQGIPSVLSADKKSIEVSPEVEHRLREAFAGLSSPMIASIGATIDAARAANAAKKKVATAPPPAHGTPPAASTGTGSTALSTETSPTPPTSLGITAMGEPKPGPAGKALSTQSPGLSPVIPSPKIDVRVVPKLF